MLPTREGSIRLFRFQGVQVFLHWSWFVVAAYGITRRGQEYSSLAWNILEYLALFAIVLMHEFGHSLACRQVGGKAEQIILWPLGGVAYVSPPPRPGATLWSIAAGPLVNVALLPILSVLAVVTRGLSGDLHHFAIAIWFVNAVILGFNLLPVYPLDGGQILRSLLWFLLGPAKSLMYATLLGFLGVVALGMFAFYLRSFWLGILAVFIVFQCWNGLRLARILMKFSKAPRHLGWACPECGEAAIQGHFWVCPGCHAHFDRYASGGVCPQCGAVDRQMFCPFCSRTRPLEQWSRQQAGTTGSSA